MEHRAHGWRGVQQQQGAGRGAISRALPLRPEGFPRTESPCLALLLLPMLLSAALGLTWPVAADGALLPLPQAQGPVYQCAPGTEATCVRELGEVYMLSSVGQNAMHGLMMAQGHFLYGHFSVRMKVAPGYTGGVLFAFYLTDTVTGSNTDPRHTEIDMEVYGGKTPRQLMLGMNVFAGGKHSLVEFALPFDGSLEYYEYAIQWNSHSITWFVAGHPFRVLNRKSDLPWPDQPMQPTLSVWDTSAWSWLKANYQNGPVWARFYDMRSIGCRVAPGASLCSDAFSAVLPWNRVLRPVELADYMRMRKQLLIKDLGWKPTV